MALTARHEQGSAFLRIPAEIRLHIYSFLLPKHRLDINLCDPDDTHPPRDMLPSKNKKASPISAMVSLNLAIEAITRSNGLHLLLVSTRTAAEYAGLLAKMAVRFHCPKCFDEWLRNVSYGLGVGIKWLKRVEILFDSEMGPRHVGPDLQGMTPALSKFMANEMMKQCQHTVYAYYGRLDLMEPPREVWKYEPYRGDSPPLSSGHPDSRSGTTLNNSAQGVSQTQINGGLHMHPWVINGGFPPPETRTLFHGALTTWRGLRRGFRLSSNLRLQPGEDRDESADTTTKWVIKGWLNV
ncbi:hypothetical protein G647_01895 [Cladophialophora carrionii CBS 160.54]|uniref:Uncharacterized protein n=1 Tax=Cladophialophora carrionii CBS 160.54 TaxID=1279043 RepID=V9DTY1_9EURO|nr:uncharacterized protein G647_01895 [Cladophialophora carrionii CBS 160.54]ETI29442.1 hypothetical protein G647_01895 [Cladophialophora carrionii CBS 160.54]